MGSCFLNDRYTDLAVVANFTVTNDEEEMNYLKTYFGDDVSEYNYARFFLMRQLLHVAYFTFFMLLLSKANEAIELDSPVPDFREFHNRMWAGEINLANNSARHQYAWVHLHKFRHNLQQQRFHNSLTIVSNHTVY